MKRQGKKEKGAFRNWMKADVAAVQSGWSGGTKGPEREREWCVRSGWGFWSLFQEPHRLLMCVKHQVYFWWASNTSNLKFTNIGPHFRSIPISYQSPFQKPLDFYIYFKADSSPGQVYKGTSYQGVLMMVEIDNRIGELWNFITVELVWSKTFKGNWKTQEMKMFYCFKMMFPFKCYRFLRHIASTIILNS